MTTGSQLASCRERFMRSYSSVARRLRSSSAARYSPGGTPTTFWAERSRSLRASRRPRMGQLPMPAPTAAVPDNLDYARDDPPPLLDSVDTLVELPSSTPRVPAQGFGQYFWPRSHARQT
jgi:hypothetical protein